MSAAWSLPGTQGSFILRGKSHVSRITRTKPVLVSKGTVSGFAISSWTLVAGPFLSQSPCFLLGTGKPGLTQQRQAWSYLWIQVFEEEE